MTQKNLKPQQAAPVQREINTASSAEDGTGLTPLTDGPASSIQSYHYHNPFAGDDAE